MKTGRPEMVLGLAAMLVCTTEIYAQSTTYVYTGSPFTRCSNGTCPANYTADYIIASVTFSAPVAGNLPLTNELSAVTGWTIRDALGYVSFGSADNNAAAELVNYSGHPADMSFSTNNVGNIVQYLVDAQNAQSGAISINPTFTGGSGLQIADTILVNQNSPTSWTAANSTPGQWANKTVGPITYTLTATPVSGTLGPSTFTNASVTVTFTGDTSNIMPGPGPYTDALVEPGTATVSVAGLGTATFTDSIVIASTFNDLALFGESAVFVLDENSGTGILGQAGRVFFGYNLQGPFGPISGMGGAWSGSKETPHFPTTAGDLTWTVGQPLVTSTFTAVTSPIPAGYSFCASTTGGMGRAYDPYTDSCVNGTVVPIVPPPGELICAPGADGLGGVYNPSSQTCVFGAILGNGQAYCNAGVNGPGGVYNPSSQACVRGAILGNGQAYCNAGPNGPGGVYNPSSQACDFGVILGNGRAYCNAGPNGPGGVYNPSSQACDLGAVFGVGQAYCNAGVNGPGGVYTLLNQNCDFGAILGNGQAYCRPGFNGPGGAYDPSTSSCDRGQIVAIVP